MDDLQKKHADYENFLAKQMPVEPGVDALRLAINGLIGRIGVLETEVRTLGHHIATIQDRGH